MPEERSVKWAKKQKPNTRRPVRKPSNLWYDIGAQSHKFSCNGLNRTWLLEEGVKKDLSIQDFRFVGAPATLSLILVLQPCTICPIVQIIHT